MMTCTSSRVLGDEKDVFTRSLGPFGRKIHTFCPKTIDPYRPFERAIGSTLGIPARRRSGRASRGVGLLQESPIQCFRRGSSGWGDRLYTEGTVHPYWNEEY